MAGSAATVAAHSSLTGLRASFFQRPPNLHAATVHLSRHLWDRLAKNLVRPQTGDGGTHDPHVRPPYFSCSYTRFWFFSWMRKGTRELVFYVFCVTRLDLRINFFVICRTFFGTIYLSRLKWHLVFQLILHFNFLLCPLFCRTPYLSSDPWPLSGDILLAVATFAFFEPLFRFCGIFYLASPFSER